MQVVSEKLSRADFAGLKGLVEDDETERLKKIVEPMNVGLRSELSVQSAHVHASPYRVDISMEENECDEFPTRFFVEILIVYLIHEKSLESIRLANYKFKKELTQGNESNWIINSINHFERGIGQFMKTEKE